MKWCEKADAMKNCAAKLMDEIAALHRNGDVNLPPPDALFVSAKGNLSKRDFNIAVCGETSQGKSAFINALIGKRLLPSNDHPTTSQLFRVSNAEKEVFQFVFTDGSVKAFTSADELLKYGTVLATCQNLDGKIIDYIDISLPLQGMPEYVHIWDTPGLGVSHFSHEEITSRCVARCDATIFLSAPKAPLTENELKFIDGLIAHGCGVCLIQSKIDLFDKGVVEEIATRNIETLNKRFDERTRKERGIEFHFIGCSVENYLKSIEAEDATKTEWFRKISGFDAVHKTISEMLFHTIGISLVAQACAEYVKYHNKLSANLAESLKILNANSKDAKDELLRKKQGARTEFEQKWSLSGTSYKSLREAIEGIISGGKRMALDLFSRNGELYGHYSEQIQRLPCDIKEIYAFSEQMSTELPGKVSDAWQRITDETKAALYDKFMEFEEEFTSDELTVTNGNTRSMEVSLPETRIFPIVRNLSIGGSVGGGVGYAAGAIAVKVGAVLAPVTGGASLAVGALLGAVAPWLGAIWGAKASVGMGRQADAITAKNQLNNSLSNYFSTVYREFTSISKVGEQSKVDEFFSTLRKLAIDKISTIIAKAKSDMENTYRNLERQSKIVADSIVSEKDLLRATQNALNEGKQQMQKLITEFRGASIA